MHFRFILGTEGGGVAEKIKDQLGPKRFAYNSQTL